MTPNPTQPRTTEARRRTREMRPDDFVQCKAFLAQHFWLQLDKQSLLARTPPDQFYAVGETLGIPSAKMAQAIADGHPQPEFPCATIHRAVRVVQRCAKLAWHKRRGGMRGDRLVYPAVELSDQVEARADGVTSRLTVKG